MMKRQRNTTQMIEKYDTNVGEPQRNNNGLHDRRAIDSMYL